MGVADNRKRSERLGLSGAAGRRKLGGRLADYAETRKTGNLLLGDIQAYMLKAWSLPSDRRTDIIHPSEMAKSDWCPLATYYRLAGLKEVSKDDKFNFVLENIFDEGHLIHKKWQRRLEKMGRLWGDWRCRNCARNYTGTSVSYCDCDCPWLGYAEVPLQSDKYMIAGHADGAIEDLGALIEIKSIGIGTLRFDAPSILERNTDDNGVIDLDTIWKELKRPLASHIKQANVYLWLCREMGYNFTKMIFLYEFKANQQVKEFVIELSEDVIQPLLDKANDVVYAVRGGKLPECPFGGCKACEAYGQSKKNEGPDADNGDSISESKAAARKRRTGRTGKTKEEPARATRRHNRSGRQRTDVSDDASNGLGELSERSTSNGTGRRTVRRKHS